MENEKMIEIIEKQIERLEELQEQRPGNLNTILAISDSIREHVALIRVIDFKLKQW